MDEQSGRERSVDLGRRDLVKIGIGAGAGIALRSVFKTPEVSAQISTNRPADVKTETREGWINDANRASGNGPIDDTTRQVIDYVAEFSESQITDSLADAVGYTLLDSMAALIAGFDSEPGRICARLARTMRSDLKSTVLGYGVTTTPEMAAFANGCMLRHTDYNDIPHNSDILSGILAMGEALHCTGTEVLVAVAIGYEVVGSLGNAARGQVGGWDAPYNGPAAAMAIGKLMKLNKDQLANALSLTLVPHLPLKVSHVGALSMWKGCHSAEAIRCAVFSTLLASEGMTGPSQPFEGRQGLFDQLGPFKTLKIPEAGPNGRSVIERAGYKRFPSEGSTQSVLEITPAIRQWTKAENIESIYVELPFDGWQETADPPKWDPRNRETADHSMPYVIARALIDGKIYVDSFTPELYMDPAVRTLMSKITVAPNYDYTYQGEARLTVTTRDGQKLVKETLVHMATPMTHQEILEKFDRVCAFRSISREQRDRSRDQWLNLRKIGDFADTMQTLAKFEPLPHENGR
jgi:2-methylcitrate dehydratase